VLITFHFNIAFIGCPSVQKSVLLDALTTTLLRGVKIYQKLINEEEIRKLYFEQEVRSNGQRFTKV